MIRKAVLVFWVKIIVVGEYVAIFERKQLSLLSAVYIYIYIYIYIYTVYKMSLPRGNLIP